MANGFKELIKLIKEKYINNYNQLDKVNQDLVDYVLNASNEFNLDDYKKEFSYGEMIGFEGSPSENIDINKSWLNDNSEIFDSSTIGMNYNKEHFNGRSLPLNLSITFITEIKNENVFSLKHEDDIEYTKRSNAECIRLFKMMYPNLDQYLGSVIVNSVYPCEIDKVGTLSYKTKLIKHSSSLTISYISARLTIFLTMVIDGVI
jgi:hypothetical protein